MATHTNTDTGYGFVLNRAPDGKDHNSELQGRILGRVTTRTVLWGALVVAVSALAFRLLDPILAAFVAIILVTAAVVAVLASDWDRHSTYEEREAVRARRRAEKWERGARARDRDRAKWQAHQAKQARQAGQAGQAEQ